MAEREIEVKGKGSFSDLKSDLDKVDAKLKGLADAPSALSKALPGLAATAGGVVAGLGAAVGIGLSFAKAAAEDEAEAGKLAKTLENATGATAEQIAAVDKWIDKTQRATGIADSELRPALSILARQTGNVTSAQNLLSLAMDISTGTGKDLSTVSTALSKILEGNTGAASKLIPELTGMAKEGASADDILAALGKTFEGQTAAHAKTAEGALAGVNVAFDEMKEKLGYKLLPVLAEFGNWLADKALPYLEDTVDNVSAWWDKQKGLQDAIAFTVEGGKELVEFMKQLAVWGKAAYDQIKPLADAIEKITGFNPTKVTSQGHALADAVGNAGGGIAGGSAGGSSATGLPGGAAGFGTPIVLQLDGRVLATAMVDLNRRLG